MARPRRSPPSAAAGRCSRPTASSIRRATGERDHDGRVGDAHRPFTVEADQPNHIVNIDNSVVTTTALVPEPHEASCWWRASPWWRHGRSVGAASTGEQRRELCHRRRRNRPRRGFRACAAEAARSTVAEYGTRAFDHECERDSWRRSSWRAATSTNSRRMIDAAKVDYRDVLMWASQPSRSADEAAADPRRRRKSSSAGARLRAPAGSAAAATVSAGRRRSRCRLPSGSAFDAPAGTAW